jgi:hypothetical protein
VCTRATRSRSGRSSTPIRSSAAACAPSLPPQGLLVWPRISRSRGTSAFVDENSHRHDAQTSCGPTRCSCRACTCSGPHRDLIARAHTHGRPVVLGGPSVSGCPEYYPTADILHVGELGDATDHVIEYLDTHGRAPVHQQRFETVTRLPLAAFPPRPYHLIPLRQYFIAKPAVLERMSVRMRVLRYPRPVRPQPAAEVTRAGPDRARGARAGGVTNVYFVDDNFIGNQKATQELCPTRGVADAAGYPAAVRVRGHPQPSPRTTASCP